MKNWHRIERPIRISVIEYFPSPRGSIYIESKYGGVYTVDCVRLYPYGGVTVSGAMEVNYDTSAYAIFLPHEIIGTNNDYLWKLIGKEGASC